MSNSTEKIKKIQGEWQKIGFHWSRGKKLAVAGLSPENIKGRAIHDLESETGMDTEFLEGVLKELNQTQDTAGSSTSKDTETPTSEESSSGGESENSSTQKEASQELPAAKKKQAAKGRVSKKAKAEQDAKGKTRVDVRNLPANEKLARAINATKEMTREIFGQETRLVGIASEMQELVFRYISTSLLALDQALDGGILRGRFTALVGPEQTCKTLIAMLVIASAQKEDPNCVCIWIDQENTFDTKWAAKMGVDVSRLLVIGPEILEDQMDILERVLWETAPAVVVYDSIGAAVSYQELETSKGVRKSARDETMAMTARTLSKFFRRFTHQIAQTGPAFIFITHLYQKIGVMFGPDTEIKGGNALKAYCTAIIETSRRKGDQDEKIKIQMPDGRIVEIFPAFELVARIHKTKQSATEGYRVAIPFIHGKGLSNIDSVIEMAIAYKVIQQSSTWYTHSPSFESTGLDNNGWINGRQKTIEFIKAHEDVYEAILRDLGKLMAQEDRHIEAEDEVAALSEGGVPMP